MPTYRDYFADIKKRIHEATPEQVQELIRSGDIQLGDVREKDEWNAGHIVGAVRGPRTTWPRPGWARSALWIPTSSISPTCSGRSFTRRIASASRRCRPRSEPLRR